MATLTLDELAKAGWTVEELDADDYGPLWRVTNADGVELVAREDGVTLPDPPTAAELTAEKNETTLRDRADQSIATLEQAWTGWGALTAAQKDAALKLTVRVVITLARLTLRKLDTGGV